jgi:hypothetical protein
MVSPIREGLTWKGNSFINTNENTGLAYYENWDYTYGKPSESLTINKKNEIGIFNPMPVVSLTVSHQPEGVAALF